MFEGTPAIMYRSLEKLRNLPCSTRVYCAHEYTVANLRFALAAEPDNAAITDRLLDAMALRDAEKPTVPSTIELELRTNPFLRCHIQAIVHSAESFTAKETSNEVDVFAALRRWKDDFRA